jgi:hypothetical protein
MGIKMWDKGIGQRGGIIKEWEEIRFGDSNEALLSNNGTIVVFTNKLTTFPPRILFKMTLDGDKWLAGRV